ncbi:MAG: hypothetical protein P8L66_06845 [Rhodospirillaceae bacterium]|nr:hypothetical protein [Rhodospirillaceae bacterium]
MHGSFFVLLPNNLNALMIKPNKPMHDAGHLGFSLSVIGLARGRKDRVNALRLCLIHGTAPCESKLTRLGEMPFKACLIIESHPRHIKGRDSRGLCRSGNSNPRVEVR